MKIKILYTINFITNGGPSRVLINLLNNIDYERYDVYLLTIIDQNDKQIIDNLLDKKIKIITIKMKKNITSLLKNYKKVVNEVNKINPDIIHTHGIVTSLIVSSKKIKAYKITTIHDNIYEDYSFTYGKIKGKIIATVHLNRLKKFNKIICCSKTSYEIIKNRFNNIDYIRNGVSSNNLEAEKIIKEKIREELGIPRDNIVYVYVGRLTKLKRTLELVKMFNNNLKENENLIIVGDGPIMNDIKKIVNEKIKIVGFKKNAIDYMIASDVYTSNSSSEGFSISVIEALESGLVLFISDIPSHKECFEIDDSYYIGEYFNKNNFKEKKDILNEKLYDVKRQDIMHFQNQYLSSKSMSSEYQELYEKGVKINEKGY